MFLESSYLPGIVGRRMELRHLRYFVAVAEEQNVTRAAARLHVSQPPLTRQIHDLEKELGVDLFERTGKSIRLTSAGLTFLKEARAALRRVEEAVETTRALALRMNSELRVGYAPSPTAGFLPAVLRAFQKQSPGTRVTLCEHSSTEMLAGLREGRLHAAFMVEPLKLLLRGLNFESLRTFPIVLAMAPDHPLAGRRAVSLAEALGEPLIAYSRKIYPDYHASLLRVAGKKMKRWRFAEECDSGTSLVAAVESGRGVAITLASLADVAGKRLHFVPLVPPPPPGVVGVAYRSGGLIPLARKLVDTARQFRCESTSRETRNGR